MVSLLSSHNWPEVQMDLTYSEICRFLIHCFLTIQVLGTWAPKYGYRAYNERWQATASSFRETPAPIFKPFFKKKFLYCSHFHHISIQLKLTAISWLLRVFRYDPSSFPWWKWRQSLCLPRSFLWSTLNLYLEQINVQCLHYHPHVAVLHCESHVRVSTRIIFLPYNF